ncbi:MAG: hypothetical protein ACI9K3_000909 [Halovenus sp.]
MTGHRDTPGTDQGDTSDSETEEDSTAGVCRAHIETTHNDHETARLLARALRPDNTAEMDTCVVGDRLVTTIERETTGGLGSNADDYIVNLGTGMQVATGERETDTAGDHNTDTDRDTTSRDTSDADTRDTETTTTTETDNE